MEEIRRPMPPGSSKNSRNLPENFKVCLENHPFERFLPTGYFDGGVFWLSEYEFLFLIWNNGLFFFQLFLAKLYGGYKLAKKKIIEAKVWASTEVKQSNVIQTHKSKKYFKFNFILISDSLAIFYWTQKSQFNS